MLALALVPGGDLLGRRDAGALADVAHELTVDVDVAVAVAGGAGGPRRVRSVGCLDAGELASSASVAGSSSFSPGLPGALLGGSRFPPRSSDDDGLEEAFATAPHQPTVSPELVRTALDALGISVAELALDGGFRVTATAEAIADSAQQPKTVYIAGSQEPASPRTRRRLYRLRGAAPLATQPSPEGQRRWRRRPSTPAATRHNASVRAGRTRDPDDRLAIVERGQQSAAIAVAAAGTFLAGAATRRRAVALRASWRRAARPAAARPVGRRAPTALRRRPAALVVPAERRGDA